MQYIHKNKEINVNFSVQKKKYLFSEVYPHSIFFRIEETLWQLSKF